MYDPETLVKDLKFIFNLQNVGSLSGSLPATLYSLPKLVIKEYLENVFQAFRLNNPIFISTAFPSEAFISQAQTADGKIDTKHKRGISIILKSAKIERNIGDIVSQYQNEEVHAVLERQDIEVIYWSLDPLDRDRGGDLLKRLLLEGIHSKYFLIKGLSIFYIEGSHDDQDTVNIISPTNILFKSNLNLTAYRFIWGRGRAYEPEKLIESIEISPNVILDVDFNMVNYFDNDYYNNFVF